MDKQPLSIKVIAIAIGAALYALGAMITEYTASPFGVGQFRPAVIIPGFFAIFFGPLVGGLSAALGTNTAAMLTNGNLLLSLMAGVPGNFVGFYLYGYMLRKFTWRKFVWATLISLFIGNLIAGLGVVSYYSLFIHGLSVETIRGWAVSLGLTAWWLITMLPFMYLALPPLLKVGAKAFPNLAPLGLKTSDELPPLDTFLSLFLPGLALLSFGILIAVRPSLGVYMMGLYKNASAFAYALKVMFIAGGVMLMVIGVAVLFALKGKRATAQSNLT
ncbi:hypothetical protein [Tardisphaera saccharovorans]|nr:hypothetical protein [TACK group archaeon]